MKLYCVLALGLCVLINNLSAQDVVHRQLQESLISAIQKNDSAAVLQLIQSRLVSVNEPDIVIIDGYKLQEKRVTMPLIFAIRKGNSALVKILLDHGADINGISYEETTKKGHSEPSYHKELHAFEEAKKIGNQDIINLIANKLN
ncbi:MAG: hypothetical protein WC707_02175 [Candidatus Babeliaceae bacterium]|jgi:ankyrin repeat protein